MPKSMKSKTEIVKRIKLITKANKDIVKFCGNDDTKWETKYVHPQSQTLTDYTYTEAKLINNGMLVMLCWVLEQDLPYDRDEAPDYEIIHRGCEKFIKNLNL